MTCDQHDSVRNRQMKGGANNNNLITISPIETLIRPRVSSHRNAPHSNNRNSNLINVNIDKSEYVRENDYLKIASINYRSLKNKYDTI